MNSAAFQKTVETRLTRLAIAQKGCFAWLCAVRALPFLSVKRGFAYWGEAEKQRHLQTVFDALDTSKLFYFPREIDSHSISRALYIAAFAANANGSRKAATAINVLENTVRGNAACAASTLARLNAGFRQIALNDMDAIRADTLEKLQNGTAIYGYLWRAFQDDLAVTGFGF